MSEVPLLFPRNMEGGLPCDTRDDFREGSKRLRSLEDGAFFGLSANIVSRAIWVDAEDFRGHVPYQLVFDLT